MTTYLTRLALLIGSMFMAMAGNLIALLAALAGSDRAWPVAVANDQALNAAMVGRAGSEDETISSRAFKASASGRRWGCILCRLLDKIERDHCRRSAEPDRGDAMPADQQPGRLRP